MEDLLNIKIIESRIALIEIHLVEEMAIKKRLMERLKITEGTWSP